jgi:hypothetical protein
VYNRVNAFSLVHQLECFIDLIQAQVVSDHRINSNHAFWILVHIAGQLAAALNPAECRAAPHSSGNQLDGRVLISCPAAATPMITDSPQPLWQHSSAARMVLPLPLHSNE